MSEFETEETNACKEDLGQNPLVNLDEVRSVGAEGEGEDGSLAENAKDQIFQSN